MTMRTWFGNDVHNEDGGGEGNRERPWGGFGLVADYAVPRSLMLLRNSGFAIAHPKWEKRMRRFRLHLVELTTARLLFEIDRPADRTVEVTFTLDPRRFSEVERILHIIFGAKL